MFLQVLSNIVDRHLEKEEYHAEYVAGDEDEANCGGKLWSLGGDFGRALQLSGSQPSSLLIGVLCSLFNPPCFWRLLFFFSLLAQLIPSKSQPDIYLQVKPDIYLQVKLQSFCLFPLNNILAA